MAAAATSVRAELPRYTVFVPLFKEVEILPHLAKALRNLDYPPAKLDIKIILEAVDKATIEAASIPRSPIPSFMFCSPMMRYRARCSSEELA